MTDGSSMSLGQRIDDVTAAGRSKRRPGLPAEARKIVEALLDGPLKFRPVETAEGKRYEVTGRIATGALLQVASAT